MKYNWTAPFQVFLDRNCAKTNKNLRLTKKYNDNGDRINQIYVM